MSPRNINNEISAEDWLLIMVGAVIGYCFLYFSSQSVVVSLVIGMPIGAGSNAMLLPLIKTLRPDLYFGFLNISKIGGSKMAILACFVGMLVVTVVWFSVYPNTISRGVIIGFDVYVVIFFMRSLRRKTKEHSESEKEDDVG